MIGLPENEPATSLSRPDAVSVPKKETPPTPKVEDSVVEGGGGGIAALDLLDELLYDCDEVDRPEPSPKSLDEWERTRTRARKYLEHVGYEPPQVETRKAAANTSETK